MKKILIPIFFFSIYITACKKDPDPVSKVVEVTSPTITLKGDPFVHIPVGGSYTDAGATLIDDISGASSDITPTTSELDVSTPGLYEIKFVAANANGFKAEAVRGVLVLDYTPPPGLDSTFDLSGQYLRAATGVTSTIYRMANGLYINDHVGGSTAVPAYFVTPDTVSFDIPVQTTFGGLDVEGTSEILTKSPTIKLSYIVLASGFGTGVRTFEKQ